MANVIIQLDCVLAMKETRDLIVLVILPIYHQQILPECPVMSHNTIYFLELTCPGDCNNAGICNTSTGQCLCTVGRHGPDCSSKVFQNITLKILQSILIFSCLEFDCPEDGTCSSQGICDNTIGSCICDVGFEGNTCKGM